MNIKMLLIAGLSLLLSPRCQASNESAESLRVVTTFYPVYVAALNVTHGVEGVEVTSLANEHIGCLHDYRLTTADMRKLERADILLASGAGMESFLGRLQKERQNLRVVEVSEGFALMDGNAQVWVSAEGAKRQVDNIAEALSAAAPDKADAFRANAKAYKEQIGELATRMQTAISPHAGTPIITFHEAFPYLARELGLEVAGVIEREPGTEPSAGELAETVKLVRERRVKALFAEPQFSGASARVIANETGLHVYELDPVVTGPADPATARGAWLGAMEKNLEVLQKALR